MAYILKDDDDDDDDDLKEIRCENVSWDLVVGSRKHIN
jgi:hypothetical protein